MTTKLDKREAVEAALRLGEARIIVDSRQPGVVVPGHLRQQDLVLKLSHRYEGHDLETAERGITCTLSFDRRPFYVVVPWAALYAVRGADEVVTVWPIPDEPPVLTKRRGGLGLVS